MSLKPQTIDFQEKWSELKETVEGVVRLRAVKRDEWNLRFSDVYALCVAYPEPLADKLYEETRSFLEHHVGILLQNVRGGDSLASGDHRDGLLSRYCAAWNEYSQGVVYLNNLYSYLNIQYIKRHKTPDAEIIYGSPLRSVNSFDHEIGQLEMGELGLSIWERVLVRPLATALSSRIVSALSDARLNRIEPDHADHLRTVVHSMVHVQTFKVRQPLALYEELVLNPYLVVAERAHAHFAADLLEGGDISHYMKEVLEGLEREAVLGARFLQSRGSEAVRACYERAAVQTHLPALYAHCPRLLREAADDAHPACDERRCDLSRMHRLLRPLGADALKPLVDAAYEQASSDGAALLAAEHSRDEAHVHFVRSMLAMHSKYSALYSSVFGGVQAFAGALDRACSKVVNSRTEPDSPCRAPELLARYCDWLLRKRAAGSGGESDAEEKLSAAILVFKYVDDKDVFQKYYARTLGRRLIHQLSCSMEQEEAMINRLKAACGYEFTNKLHRMFTDVAVSADLNAKFQQHLRDSDLTLGVGFFIQVLQAGAWPLGGAMAPLSPPAQLERPARLFESFYRASFSGRRLAWLHHLCTGELRTKYTHRLYHVSATTPQCALLLCFETMDSAPAHELRDSLELPHEAWVRHARPLVEAGLLTAEGDLDDEQGLATISLNLTFQCKRTRVKLTCAATTGGGSTSGPGAEPGPDNSAHCEDDRKMYLQAALVRIMKQRKILRHNELIQEVVQQARGSFAPSVAMIKKCIESLIDKQYLERVPGCVDTYSYVA